MLYPSIGGGGGENFLFSSPPPLQLRGGRGLGGGGGGGGGGVGVFFGVVGGGPGGGGGGGFGGGGRGGGGGGGGFFLGGGGGGGFFPFLLFSLPYLPDVRGSRDRAGLPFDDWESLSEVGMEYALDIRSRAASFLLLPPLSFFPPPFCSFHGPGDSAWARVKGGACQGWKRGKRAVSPPPFSPFFPSLHPSRNSRYFRTARLTCDERVPTGFSLTIDARMRINKSAYLSFSLSSLSPFFFSFFSLTGPIDWRDL